MKTGHSIYYRKEKRKQLQCNNYLKTGLEEIYFLIKNFKLTNNYTGQPGGNAKKWTFFLEKFKCTFFRFVLGC